jgi:succinate dehydrogenase iron-sulfur subunit
MTTVTETPASTPVPPAAPHRGFRILRHHRGHPARWDHFKAPVPSARTTVLDALTWIRTHLDPTLDIRHSCYHASCGTCGMRINGREGLACVTRLADLGDGDVTVEPLLNQPIVSDLVTDLEALYESFEQVGLPLIRESDLVPGAVPAEGVDRLTRFEDCIECGLCVSACPVEASDPAYAGPAVLGAAWRIIEEPRDADPERAFALVDGDQGAWRCHLAFECTEACPSDALPAEHIMHLRHDILRHRLRAAFGRLAHPGSNT